MNDNRRMASRLLSFAVWAVVLASTLFWGLKVFVPRPGLPPQAQAPARAAAVSGEWQRLLGASVVAAAAEDDAEPSADAERFQLLGVVAPRGASHSAQGVALIAVDGQPARPWRTGATVADDVVLLAVDRRSVKLGPRGGPATTELSLPDPTEAHAGAAAPRVPGQPMQPGAVLHGAQPLPRPGMQPQGMLPGQVQQPQRPGQPQQPQQQNGNDEEDE